MSNQLQVTLAPLEPDDKEQFILDNQWAFKYGATEEFGVRDDHFEEDGEIISRDTIEQSINNGKAYRILLDGEKVGGVVVSIDKAFLRGELELLFVKPDVHSKGVGYSAWGLVEKMYPEIIVWETCAPYFEACCSAPWDCYSPCSACLRFSRKYKRKSGKASRRDATSITPDKRSAVWG